MTVDLRVNVHALSKTFDRRVIFRNISFSLGLHQTLLITGRNGSGKSTLVRILSGVLTPTRGSVQFKGPQPLKESARQAVIGLVSPYMQLFDEFSARENLEIAQGIRGERADRLRIDALLERLSLFERRNDPVRTYSSGMKQRAKYALALVHEPTLLVLDEPMANLDDEGVRVVRRIMEEHRRRGILVVATNDPADLGSCDQKVDLNEAR